MTTFFRDVLYAARALRKSPGFSAAVIATLALGIGASTAMFSVVYGVLLRPFPYPNAGQIVVASESYRRSFERSVSIPNFRDWKTQSGSFQSMGIVASWNFIFNGVETPERLSGALASHDFFLTLGVRPILGRTFLPGEDRPGGPRSVVLSESLWRRLFAGSSAAVGQHLLLSGESWTVVGVVPANLELPSEETQIWACLAPLAAELENRGAHAGFEAYARLREGVSLDSARTDLDIVSSRLAAEYPDTNRDSGVAAVSLSESVAGRVKPALLLLLGAVGLMLLIACANTANLLLVRATGRRREIAIRRALGASPTRLLKQLLTESIVFALAGGGAGTLLASAIVPLLPRLLPGDLPRAGGIAVNLPVLLFALTAAIVSGVLFGLAPALQGASRNPARALADGGRGDVGGRSGHARDILLVSEIALAALLAAASGLLLRSFLNLQAASPGLNPRDVLAAEIRLPDSFDDAHTITFAEQALGRVAALPGVQSAGSVIPLPLSGQGFQDSVRVERDLGADPNGHHVDVAMIGGSYFQTMRVPLLEGRRFEGADRADTPAVVVVDETFARRAFPGRSPIGARLRLVRPKDPDSERWRTIVGVVSHVKNYGAGAESRPEIYFPLSQRPVGRFNLVLRSSMDPATLAAAVRLAVREVNAEIPVYNVRTLDAMVARSTATPRFTASLLSLFAAAAILLAAIGTYGVASYGARLRAREFAVRIALGARPADLARLVLNGSLKRTLLGLAIGALGTLALSRLLESLLFGVRPVDPAIFASAAACVFVTSVAAGLLPARRAARTDPIEALRGE